MPNNYDTTEAREMHGWISITHKLPPPHTHVWCLNKNGIQFEGCVCYGMHKPFFTFPHGWETASDTVPDWIDVTHWREMNAHDGPHSIPAACDYIDQLEVEYKCVCEQHSAQIDETLKLEARERRLVEALKELLGAAVILSRDYLETFRSHRENEAIYGFSKVNWVKAADAADNARAALAATSTEEPPLNCGLGFKESQFLPDNHPLKNVLLADTPTEGEG